MRQRWFIAGRNEINVEKTINNNTSANHAISEGMYSLLEFFHCLLESNPDARA